MKKILTIILILIAILVGGFTFCKYSGNCNFFKKKETNVLVATSNYGDVYKSDIISYLDRLEKIFSQKISFDSLTPEEKQSIIKEVVNQRKILNDAKQSDIIDTELYRLSLENLKDDLTREMYLNDLINKNITDEKIKDKYKELKNSLTGKKEYKVKHILVETEEEIKKVQKELKTGKFEEVAKKYSKDTTSQSGGDLGYLTEGQTVKEFEDEMKKAKINKVSDYFKTEFGWHILLKEDERNIEIPEFDTVKSNLKNELVTEYIKKYSEDNIANANVVFVDENK